MPDQEWQDAVAAVAPYVVKISTPDCFGSGFMVYRSSKSPFCAVATAAHVVNDADEWGKPIRLQHHHSGRKQLIRPEDRVIYHDPGTDTAVVLFHPGEGGDAMPLPAAELNLWAEGKYLKIGNEVGWVGFPVVSPDDLCFFSGRISCYRGGRSHYLIDGVAINGVSGGPAFFPLSGGPSVIGVISAYIPNQSTGASLPGLAIVQDVTRLHEWVSQFRSLDEARDAEPPEPSPPPAPSGGSVL